MRETFGCTNLHDDSVQTTIIITQISLLYLLASPPQIHAHMHTCTHKHINTYAPCQWKFPHHDSHYDSNCYIQHFHSNVNKHHHQTAEQPNF